LGAAGQPESKILKSRSDCENPWISIRGVQTANRSDCSTYQSLEGSALQRSDPALTFWSALAFVFDRSQRCSERFPAGNKRPAALLLVLQIETRRV
jgi:hypothetical protein